MLLLETVPLLFRLELLLRWTAGVVLARLLLLERWTAGVLLARLERCTD